MYTHSVMRSLGSFVAKDPDVGWDNTPVAAPDVDRDHLIELFVETDERQVRIMGDGSCVGVVTRMGLLRGIQGKEDQEI